MFFFVRCNMHPGVQCRLLPLTLWFEKTVWFETFSSGCRKPHSLTVIGICSKGPVFPNSDVEKNCLFPLSLCCPRCPFYLLAAMSVWLQPGKGLELDTSGSFALSLQTQYMVRWWHLWMDVGGHWDRRTKQTGGGRWRQGKTTGRDR